MKVLIISHLPIATQNNMGKTFLSLFSGLERQELCQFYIYPAFPDLDRCDSFYRVTDKEILKSLPLRTKVGGCVEPERITADQGLYENPEDESFYRDRKNKSALRRLLRDGIWRWGNWYNATLRQWLQEQKPDCIFLAPGPAKFIYNIALKIAKDYKIPIVTYICDEYYFVDTPGGLLPRIQLRRLQKKIRQTIQVSAELVAICDEMKAEYACFGTPITTVMTGASFPVAREVTAAQPDCICYFGNIRCNRYISLAQVGRALDDLNGKLGTDYQLKIYTPEKDPQILSEFDGVACVELPGFVTGEAYAREFDKAQRLLHVEAFDEASIAYVRNSVSTKIADSLASGKPLLAYGPKEVASMGHLLRNACAITATDVSGLEGMLLTAFTDKDACKAAADRGLQVARRHHDSNQVGKEMRAVFARAIKE